MRAKPKQTRNTFTPAPLVKQLAKDVPGFKAETPQVQAALAYIVWRGATERRRHTVHDGYMSFHHKELAQQFGGQFKAINARLGFLEVKKTADGKDSWRWSADAQASDVFTKGYRFSPVVQASREAFLAKRVTRLSKLLDASGKVIRKPDSAVASLDTKGLPTTRWRVANNGDRLTRVPVDIPTLRKFHQKYSRDADECRRTGQAPSDLLTTSPSLETLVTLRDKTAQVIHMAHKEVAGLGNVLHRYVESPSGRLYAEGGGSLQNAPKEIRKAALVGLWDYDVENCHFAIMAQMAKRAGEHCDAIEHYMAHKKPIRAEIAKAVGISIDDTKTCLLALMYGARTTAWDENAIPETIGVEAARRLYALPLFANISDDVKRAGKAILKQHEPNRQGGLVNAFGKSIDTKSREKQKNKPAKKAPTASQKLAHLVQGVEALALWTCIERHPGEIVLVQHDGFTAIKQLDKAELERAITAATGYVLKLEEELVQPDLGRQYDQAVAKDVKREYLKARKGRKASNGAGFSHILPTANTINSAGAS